jgi:alcohol dehydrogenase (cytochrome c)
VWPPQAETAKAKQASLFYSSGMSGGVLTTAGRLLFTGDSGELVAFDPADGNPLWRQRLTGAVSKGPSTWAPDGKQYMIVGAGDTLHALTLAGKGKIK